MSRKKSSHSSVSELARSISAARGNIKASLSIRNASFLDVFSGEFRRGDVTFLDQQIIGIMDRYDAETEIDGRDLYLVPGFIDAHVHIESSLMTPARFAESVIPQGTVSYTHLTLPTKRIV